MCACLRCACVRVCVFVCVRVRVRVDVCARVCVYARVRPATEGSCAAEAEGQNTQRNPNPFRVADAGGGEPMHSCPGADVRTTPEPIHVLMSVCALAAGVSPFSRTSAVGRGAHLRGGEPAPSQCMCAGGEPIHLVAAPTWEGVSPASRCEAHNMRAPLVTDPFVQANRESTPIPA